jgi:hypothetical protein
MPSLRLAIRYSLSDGIPYRSACVALVVGTILNLINQGDAIVAAHSVNWIKILLTYFVPYAVSTYGAVSYRLSRAAPPIPERSATSSIPPQAKTSMMGDKSAATHSNMDS